ncbi:hypothetical protein [Stenomitos frigidus]|uniref:Uncharacterized protein n=1 Tax=Stenomitos frigidus ULC18 TaxID=2107698 RepID=A0A2T1DX30_9CYAN|nr:hypothetical protein [Stenomitos frigidus]PSB25045.1 hypothetical protein C7B82_24540 [Stenomitos frigidus ULC18]
MKLVLDATQTNAEQIERLATLMIVLSSKAKAFQAVSVRVVHRFAQRDWEQNFTFLSFAGDKHCLRGCGGSTIQRDDYIVLQNASYDARYQVDEIDYDAAQSDFWVALLHPCCEPTTDRSMGATSG